MSDAARAAVLDDYRARRVTVVCNAMLWTEGFDDPQTSCIALVRPTGSRALVAQMIGRGTRTAPGKPSCLVLDFVPGRASKLRLASPHDVLAGDDLPAETKPADRRMQRERIAAELERRRWIREVGVIYAAPQLDVDELLQALGSPDGGPSATPRQIEALRGVGFDVSADLTRSQASALFGVLEQRRAAGLCSLKQARTLRRLGFGEDFTAEQAAFVLDAMAAARWRMSGAARAQLMAELPR
jgi:hypothetical protein